jgi:hypothetical protein
MKKKVWFLLVSCLIVISMFFYFSKKGTLQEQYEHALKTNEIDYINSFFQQGFSGRITYIKIYREHPDKYVIGITENNKKDRTIGKVEITNFQNIKQGDSIRKEKNSFLLIVYRNHEKAIAIVKYQ